MAAKTRLSSRAGADPETDVAAAVTAFAAFLRRDWAIAWSYRFPFLFGLAPAFSSVVMLFFLSRLVGHRAPSFGGGIRQGYFAFSVIGTLLLATFGTFLTSFAGRVRADQLAGTLEILFSMPAPPVLSALGSASYQLLLASGSSLASLVLAIALGLRFHASPMSVVVAIATLVTTALLFTAAGIAFAAFVVIFKRGETLGALVISLLTVIGGVYYPLALMPRALRYLAEAVPFTWALSVLRACLFAGSTPLATFGLLAAVTGAALPAAVRLFGYALDRSRSSGTLGQY